MTESRLVACHACDMLQHKVPLPPGTVANCARCGTRLYRHSPRRLDLWLAWVISSLIVLTMANAFPIITLELQGIRQDSTLFAATRAMYAAGLDMVALLVLITTIVFPFIELLLLLSVLWPLYRGNAPDGHVHLRLRALQLVRPWIMLDVFFMGVLVALVKLLHTATVIPGLSLWAFVVLVFLMAAVATISPHDLWERIDEAGGSKAGARGAGGGAS